MARSHANRARARIELERDDDVRPCRNARRPARTFAAVARSAGRDGRLHGVHLLDFSAAKHGIESGAGRLGGVSADAGARADFFG